jgi:hypothetical protein
MLPFIPFRHSEQINTFSTARFNLTVKTVTPGYRHGKVLPAAGNYASLRNGIDVDTLRFLEPPETGGQLLRYPFAHFTSTLSRQRNEMKR